MFLTESDFRSVVTYSPLFSIDFLITHNSKVLLGKRVNRPAQGAWFVPGGRVRKNEAFKEAVSRISMAELGVELAFSESQPVGLYEHFYRDSICDGDVSTHYVAYGIQFRKNLDLSSIPKDQHSSLAWWDTAQALQSDEVHGYTKDYLNDGNY